MQGNGSIDLAALDTKRGAEEGFKLELVHPTTSQPLGVWIHVLGEDSDTHEQYVMELERVSNERLRTNMRLNLTPEEKLENELSLLVADTRGWSDNMTLDGQPLAFSPAAARALYRRFKWIRRQVDQAIYKRANFLPAPASSS